MKKAVICLMIFFFLVLAPGPAISQYSVDVTGDNWMGWETFERTVFVWGFLKGMDHIFKELWGRSICTATADVYVKSPDMVYLYLQAHPECRSRPMERIIFDALKGHLFLWDEKNSPKRTPKP